MYSYHLTLIIANWTSLFISTSSENLLLNNPDELLWDPNSAVDNIDSGIDMMSFDDIDSVVDPISFLQDDDDQTLFASTPSQRHCDAADGDAIDFTLAARDDELQSCQTNPKGSSSSPPPAILSPETMQLFQDPSSLLNNFLSPKQSPPPSGSGEPPPNDPNDPNDPNNNPVFYPGHLSDEDADQKTRKEFEWDLDPMKLTPIDNDFFCTTQRRDVPVCCDGPFNVYGHLERCDGGTYGRIRERRGFSYWVCLAFCITPLLLRTFSHLFI